MALTVSSLPHQAINGINTRWNALHHPINYVIQRRDQNVQIRYNSGASVVINMIGAVDPSAVVGSYIQYFTSNGTVYTLQITAVTTNNITVTGATFTGSAVGGYVNYLSRSAYYIETEILHVDASYGFVSLGKMRHTPDIQGNIELNVATLMKGRTVFPNLFEYDQINKAMPGEGGRYSLRFYEYYNGQQTIIGELFDVDYWTNSAKQVGDLYGSNMAKYVPTVDAARTDKAKFLTTFEQPTYFVGFPFSLSFIFSDNIAPYVITREEERFDVNGASLSTDTATILNAERWNVNRLMLEGSYSTGVETVQVWLESGAAISGNQVEAVEGSIAASGVFADIVTDINDLVM